MEINPSANSLAGVLFGANLFPGADGVALAALGLSKKATAYSLSKHVYGLISHAVYGVTTKAVRRAVCR